MADFDLTQSDAQIQGILNAIQPFYMAGDLNALGFGYGDCTTAGGTAAKTVAIANTILTKGGCISVNFQNGFTAASPTLSVNGSAAYPIRMYGSAIPTGKVKDNTILTMRFDGSSFNVIAIESQFKAPADAIDLALPSGVLWCDHNVGAQSPEDYGDFFSWANIDGHAEGGGYSFDQSTYDATTGKGLTTNIPVGNTYDSCRHNQGSPWRMPTRDDYIELVGNCNFESVEQNGVFGFRFTSIKNGLSVFFPASGYYNAVTHTYKGVRGIYWSSTKRDDSYSYQLVMTSSGANPSDYNQRRYGVVVRGVI